MSHPLENGSLTITCRDLTAVWFEAECADK
jgi:hypothetical protein